MAITKAQFEILRQLFDTADETQKAAFVDWMNSASPADKPVEISTVESFLSSHKEVIHVCPHCGGTHLVKNGKHNGHQRFICKDCHKTIGFSKDSILFSTKKDMDTWTLYIHCMAQKFPLRKCMKECGICLKTAFVWRHKILDALTNMMNEVLLDGVVECDETFQLISYKGNHKKSSHFTMPRKPRKRAGKAEKRGLSKEQVCVTCGVDLGGHSIGKVSNLGTPNHKDIASVLGQKIATGAIMVTDSRRGYCKLADDMELSHIRIPRHKHSLKGFNIQTVNSYHSRLKGMINGLFHGVATKYINNYVVYHNLVGYARGTESHKESVMLDFVFTTACMSLWSKNATRPAIPCVA